MGTINNKLAACPNSPNCICSEFPEDEKHYSPPLTFVDNLEASKLKAKKIINNMGAKITKEESNYIAATFSVSIFKFVDDFELRFDEAAQQIHIRSASRVGYSDLGENKRRVTKFKHLWEE